MTLPRHHFCATARACADSHVHTRRSTHGSHTRSCGDALRADSPQPHHTRQCMIAHQGLFAESALYLRRRGGDVDPTQLGSFMLDKIPSRVSVNRLLYLLSASAAKPFNSLSDVLEHVRCMPLARMGLGEGVAATQSASAGAATAAAGSTSARVTDGAKSGGSGSPAEDPATAKLHGSGPAATPKVEGGLGMRPDEDLKAHIARLRRAIEGATTSAAKKQAQGARNLSR